MLSYPTFHKFRKKGKLKRCQSKDVKIIQAFYFQKVIMHQKRLCEISTLGCFITNNLFRKLIYSSFLQLHYRLVYLAVIWSCLSSPKATEAIASKALAVTLHTSFEPRHTWVEKVSFCPYLYCPICAASQKPSLICIQGHGADLCIAMATRKLFDFLPGFYQPEGNSRPHIRADYLGENSIGEKLNTVSGSTTSISIKKKNLDYAFSLLRSPSS